MYSEKISYELVREIVNKHDPFGLIALGAQNDEYSLEAKSIYATISKNESSELMVAGHLEETIKEVFAQKLSKNNDPVILARYKKIADDILDILDKNKK